MHQSGQPAKFWENQTTAVNDVALALKTDKLTKNFIQK
jgi:hypothetical protein